MRLLVRVLATCPQHVGARLYLGWTLQKLHRHEEALRQYEDLLQRKVDHADVYLGFGASLYELGRYEEATRAFRVAAEKEPENTLMQSYLASSYVAEGNMQDALVIYRRVARLRPTDTDTIANFAATLLKLGHWEEAAAYSQRALDMRPNSVVAYNLGVALSELERYGEAAQAFRTSMELGGAKGDVAIRLALTLLQLKRTSEALELLEGDATEYGDDEGARLAVLTQALLCAERIPDALETARLAVEKRPDLPTSHAALGWAAVNAGFADAALRSFDEALRLEPNVADYEVGRGAALSLLERHGEAVEQLERVLAASADDVAKPAELRRYLDRSRKALEIDRTE